MEVGHWWYGGESPHLGLLSQENNIKIEEKVKVNWIGQVGENGQYSSVDSKVPAGQDRRIQHPRGWVLGTVFSIDWLTNRLSAITSSRRLNVHSGIHKVERQSTAGQPGVSPCDQGSWKGFLWEAGRISGCRILSMMMSANKFINEIQAMELEANIQTDKDNI